jgi:hypothetical protein
MAGGQQGLAEGQPAETCSEANGSAGLFIGSTPEGLDLKNMVPVPFKKTSGVYPYGLKYPGAGFKQNPARFLNAISSTSREIPRILHLS